MLISFKWNIFEEILKVDVLLPTTSVSSAENVLNVIQQNKPLIER